MLKKTIRNIWRKPGLLLLILLLTAISITSIKPGFYFMGWDNYSSYFNPKTNLFRTLFSIWRAYRGLGVPSDSEVTDITRQGISYLLGFVFPHEILDQMYVLSALWIGVLGMYWFVWHIFTSLFGQTKEDSLFHDITSSFASLFYLFNLNTLSVFSFPIITYITRFAAIPILFTLFFLLYEKQKRYHRNTIILFILGVFLTSGSYITATVFITMVIALGIFSSFLASPKRIFLVFFLYIGLNCYWLIPFVNYTSEKAATLRYPPAFVSANESQWNRSSKNFSLRLQLILYPNSFEEEYTDALTNQTSFFHPVLNRMHTTIPWGLYIFPALYIIGSILLCIQWKKKPNFFWIPISLWFFLIISMREYSVFGWLYYLFDTYVPYFHVVFRFGDTKFHPYVLFFGCIAASYALLWCIQMLRHNRIHYLLVFIFVGITGIVAGTVYVFPEYLNGNFFPTYFVVKLPEAYRQVTDLINADKKSGKVLHLPFEQNGYWKSYAWGYLGSSFLHFMLDKPFFDRTFEPASIETTYVFQRLTNILSDAQQIADEKGKSLRAQELYAFLRILDIRYVIVDHSVTPESLVRGIRYWGIYNLFDSQLLLDMLEITGQVQRVGEYTIPIGQLSASYIPNNRMTQGYREQLEANKNNTLIVYRISGDDAGVRFLPNVANVDSGLSNSFTSNLHIPTDYVEDVQRNDTLLFPFEYRNAVIAQSQNTDGFSQIGLTIPNPWKGLKDTPVRILSKEDPSSNAAQSFLIQVTGEATGNEYIFRFYTSQTPRIGTISEVRQNIGEIRIPVKTIHASVEGVDPLSSFAANWNVLGDRTIGPLRLSVDDVIVPVPDILTEGERSLADVIVHTAAPRIGVLLRSSREILDLSKMQLVDTPNCYGDALPDYTYAVDYEAGFTIRAKNGSTCFWRNLPELTQLLKTKQAPTHAEFRFVLSGQQKDREESDIGRRLTSKPNLTEYIRKLPKPSVLFLCIKQPSQDMCYNLHFFFEAAGHKEIIVPTERSIRGIPDILLFSSLLTFGKQESSMNFESIRMDTFHEILSSTLSIPEDNEPATGILPSQDSLTVQFPKPLSLYSYYYQPVFDSLQFIGHCTEKDGYYTVRMLPFGYVSYVENCASEVSVQLPFTGSMFGLWMINYTLFSGQYPQVFLRDSFAHYIDEFLSYYQGYPQVPGFGQFQQSETWYRQYSDITLGNAFRKNGVQTAYTYIRPKPELSDTRDKTYVVNHRSGGDGALGIYAFDIVELPSSWSNLRLELGKEEQRSYTVPDTFSVREILPSLKIVTVQPDRRIGTYFIVTSDGYDRQWSAYPNIVSLILGAGGTPAKRCNGYANCFEVPASGVYYLFYTPEKLSFLGWIVTLATVSLACIFSRRFFHVS